MDLHAFVDMSQWHFHSGLYGTYGVRYVIAKCAMAGISRVLWRPCHVPRPFPGETTRRGITDLGREQLFRGVTEVASQNDWHEFIGHRQEWDPVRIGDKLLGCEYLKEAVRCAHQLGVEIYFCCPVTEESHTRDGKGVHLKGEKFAHKTRLGYRWYESLCYAYPEVVQSRIEFLTELAGYGPDGFILDFSRFGTCPKSTSRFAIPEPVDDDGCSILGYNEVVIDDYVQHHSTDPRTLPNSDERWLLHRASYLTRFLREVRKTLIETGKVYGLMALVRDHNSLPKALLDWETWVEEGLIDELSVSTPKARDAERIAVPVRRVREKCGTDFPVSVALDCSHVDADLLRKTAKLSEEVGARSLLLDESHHIEMCPAGAHFPNELWITLEQLGTESNAQNAVECQWTAEAPVIDGQLLDRCWRRADAIADFGVMADDSQTWQPAAARTTAFTLHDKRHLYIGVICGYASPEQVRASENDNGAWIDEDDIVEVYLDVEHEHVNYYVFRVNPHGLRSDGSLRDPNWNGKWKAASRIEGATWSVELAIPFENFGFRPWSGDVFGFNVARRQASTSEVSAWRPLGTHPVYHALGASAPFPIQFGDLTFI